MHCGSDAHTVSMIGTCPNNIRASDLDSVIKALKGGKVSYEGKYVSIDKMVEWNRTRLLNSYMDVVDYVDRCSALRRHGLPRSF